jgi:hypothetical protein
MLILTLISLSHPLHAVKWCSFFRWSFTGFTPTAILFTIFRNPKIQTCSVRLDRNSLSCKYHTVLRIHPFVQILNKQLWPPGWLGWDKAMDPVVMVLLRRKWALDMFIYNGKSAVPSFKVFGSVSLETLHELENCSSWVSLMSLSWK